MKKYLVFIIIVLALLVGLFGKLLWSNYQLSRSNEQINSELMQANLEIGRAHTEIGNANKKVASLNEELRAEVKELKATVTLYGELEAKYDVLKKQKGKVTIEYIPGDPIEIPCPEAKFVRGFLYEAITENTLAPIQSLAASLKDERLDVVCMIEPYANMERDIPFKVGYSLHFRLKGQLIETKTKSGAINHFINLTEVDENGQELGKMELTKFEVVTNDETEPHFIFWTPHIDIGILAGWSNYSGLAAGGSIGFSPMGYGRTVNDLTWRFARVSLDLSDIAGLGLSPVVYNIGDPLPLVSNIWVGPHIMWSIGNKGLLGIFVGGVL